MNIEDINLGDPPTGAGGDTMRTAFGKTNQNFGAAKQALEDEVQTREQLLATQRDQLIALIESVNGPLPALRADFKARSFGTKNEAGMFLPCAYSDIFSLSAPSPKWVWNAQGQLVKVPAGQPAWNHDPLTGGPLGQRIESVEDTNLFPLSRDVSQWNRNKGITVTTGVSHPKFPWEISRITEDSSTGYHLAQHLEGASSTNEITAYFVVKNESSRRYLGFGQSDFTSWSNTIVVDTETMTVVSDVYDAGIVVLGDGFFLLHFIRDGWSSGGGLGRLSVGFLDGPSHANAEFTGDESSSLLIAHVQREEATAYSSIIPTDGGAVTRAADVMTANTAFAEQYDPERGWLFIDSDLETDDTIVFIATPNTSNNNSNSIMFYRGEIRVYNGTSTIIAGTYLPNAGKGHHKVLFKWGAGEIVIFLDGEEAVRISGDMPDTNEASFFRRKDSAAPGSGHLFEFQMGDTISDAAAIARTAL